jgi:branched-chain amino acid aminotransferase
MTTLVMINGQLVAPEAAHVTVFDRGLLYGDSVFETLGTYGGKPFAIVEHVRRLRHSADLVFIELLPTDEELIAEIVEAVRAANNPESYIRVIVTRGSGELGLDPALAVSPQRIIIVTALHRPNPKAYEEGVTAITYRTQRATDDTRAVGAKVGNYLVAVLAMKLAKPVGANEALIVDGAGRIVEGATSNVFLVKNGALVTPPESAGILSGITRQVVLEAAREEGLTVQFECPTVADVLAADEVFITSSIRQMLAITRVDEHPIGGKTPGPIYRRLEARFHAVVRQWLERDEQRRLP